MNALILFAVGILLALLAWKALQNRCVYYYTVKHTEAENPIVFWLFTISFITMSLLMNLLGIFWLFY